MADTSIEWCTILCTNSASVKHPLTALGTTPVDVVRVVLDAAPPDHTSVEAVCDCSWRVVRNGTDGVLIRRVAAAAVRHHYNTGHRIKTPVLDNIEVAEGPSWEPIGKERSHDRDFLRRKPSTSVGG